VGRMKGKEGIKKEKEIADCGFRIADSKEKLM
jgi:hypothetical protein